MDGLWTAEFGSSAGVFGGAVVIFQDGRILGGDSGYYYIGEYKQDGNSFQATIRATPFIEGYESAFRTVGKTLTLDLTGSLVDENRATAQGRPREMPELRLGVKLTRRT
jgi:hypothetical protein